MKYLVSALVLTMFGFGANAAQNGRPAMAKNIISAPRYTASVNQVSGPMTVKGKAKTQGTTAEPEQETEEVQEQEEETAVDMREAERNACINNNIGVGNTFVWASKYSDTSNYATMVEDAEHPENNVCFVRVELKSSNESRIKVSDIAPKYFMWGEPIKCGSWVSKKEMEKRILDARKGERIGGIIATTVGGAGLGVGAMELFGNKLIGGKVMGQKGVEKKEVYKAQLSKEGNKEYVASLKVMVDACNDSKYADLISDCDTYTELYKAVSK
jgi:hypothetical protein